MRRMWIAVGLTFGALSAWTGCGVMSAASMGMTVGKNMSSNKLGVRVFLDGHEAKRDELKQAVTGYSRWKVKELVDTSPELKFEFKEPDALGRITTVIVSIHQKFEANYSDHAEFTVVSRSQDPMAQMKPDTVYDLAALPGDYKVIDYKGSEVGKVELKPGMEYMLNLTVKADASETAQIYFKTK